MNYQVLLGSISIQGFVSQFLFYVTCGRVWQTIDLMTYFLR